MIRKMKGFGKFASWIGLTLCLPSLAHAACIEAYEHSSYRGQKWIIGCGSSHNIGNNYSWNDKISSIKVIEGSIIFCEHVEHEPQLHGTGQCAFYNSNTANVGSALNDKFSFYTTEATLLNPSINSGDSRYFYETDGIANVAPNWMYDIADNIKMSQLSIPGTHQSASRVGGAFLNFAKNQSMSIYEQLITGVRSLDVRVRSINNIFTVHHGEVYQELVFGQVMDEIEDFLRNHPTETIILRLNKSANVNSGEGSASFKRVFYDTYYYPIYQRKNLFYVNDYGKSFADLSIGELRGKVLLVSTISQDGETTVGVSGQGIGVYGSTVDTQSDMDIISISKDYNAAKQASWSSTSDYQLLDLAGYGYNSNPFDSSSEAVQQDANQCLDSHQGSIALVPCLIEAGFTFFDSFNIWFNPAIYARHMNEAVYNDVRNLPDSLIQLDFPGGHLIQKIIDKNRKFKKDVSPFDNANHCGSKAAIFRIVNSDLTLHALGGNFEANPIALHGGFAYAKTKNNSKFRIIPTGDGDNSVILKTVGSDLTLHAWGGSISGANIRLHHGVGYARNHANSKFKIIETEAGSGRYLLKVSNADLTMHAYGGTRDDASIKLHGGEGYAKTRLNSQFEIYCVN